MIRPKLKAGEERRKLPVVIALHGTGDRKEGMEGLLRDFASHGFLGVAIDGRYHGERAGERAGEPARDADGADPYDQAILRAFRQQKEHPFLYDTVWDAMRLIDWLETQPDVDASRIALMAISKGGMETWLTAAVDPRVAVAVPCIGVQSFAWALENNRWQARAETIGEAVEAAAAESKVERIDAAFMRRFYDRVVPGIYSTFDGPAMLPLIAPRPLLVVNGDSDSLTPAPGVQLAVDAARKAYGAAGASDKVKLIFEEHTGHQVTAEALREIDAWLVRWLR
jgi:dienelactone hydrolase